MADVTDATFEADVIERSREVPVVVDLWAPWCGPCRTLGPVLEDVVGATEGKVELVKVNVDENPQISQAFRVQSIPAVYALKDGRVVDGFIGAQPKPAVEKLVDSLLPTVEEAEVDRLVRAGDEASLRAALERDPDHAGAVVALAELLVGGGRGDEALTLLARIPESAETRRVAAQARLGAVEGDGAAAAADDGLTGRLDALLDRVKDDDGARQEFLDVLELLGPEDPRTASYRKALTARLF
jgi:putative thioredoxin